MSEPATSGRDEEELPLGSPSGAIQGEMQDVARQPSFVRYPQRGAVYRDVNGADPTLHAGAYATPVDLGRSVDALPHSYVLIAWPATSRLLDIPSPRWAVLPPSWLAQRGTRPAAAPE